MKKSLRFISLLLLICITLTSLTACDAVAGALEGVLPGEIYDLIFGEKGPSKPTEMVDYVDLVKLDKTSTSKKMEVDVRYFIDGDTTHFFPKGVTDPNAAIKARYLGVDTPESTGQIEEWGKKASSFTEEKLDNAVSIIIESDSSDWAYDANGRSLLWIWYQPAKGADYRNLNLELVQAGLGNASSDFGSLYAESVWNAYEQAIENELYIHSDDKDPEFPYGAATPVTIKELRLNIDKYYGQRVSIEGISNFNANNTANLEEYDAETDTYYSIQVFYGYTSSYIQLFTQGNKLRVVGVVGEHFGTYQISDIKYNPMKPNDPANTSLLSKGNEVDYVNKTVAEYNQLITIEKADGTVITKPYRELAVASSISMDNLKIKKITTTTNESSNDYGAMTIYCEQNGQEVSIRTEVFKDNNGDLITPSYFTIGGTISVKGIIDYYDPDMNTDTDNGIYQIRVYNLSDITKH